jgi:predicted dehydrogenase
MKAGILGLGNMGLRHAESIKKLGVQINAICDSNQKTVNSFKDANSLNAAASFTDFDGFLKNGDFDVLFICLPPFAQDNQFEKAAIAGKHIFIEKPIALKSSVGARMVRSAKERGITTMVGFHMRKGAAVRRLAELVQRGESGRAVLFNAQYQCNSLHAPWWINADLCGGQIFEQAIHIYDLCRFLFGDPKFVEGLMANVCHNHIRNYTVEDVSACIAGFSTGALASITANNCAIPGKWIGRVTATFEKITAELLDHNHGTITFTSGEELKTETISGEEDPYLEEVREFLECAEKGRQTSCDIIEGYKSLCFVETVVLSAKSDGVKLSLNTHY